MRSKKSAVSLVVTVKNDAAALRELLSAIEKQTKLPDEAIIVVAGSDDGTLAAARSWRPKNLKALILDRPRANRSAGRNLGVERSAGEMIVFTDAGCRPEVDWLEQLLAPLSDPEVNLVSGFTDGDGRNSFEEAQVPFVLVPLGKIPPHPLPATRNMAIRRKVFQQWGGFRADLNYAEDFEFSRRLEKEGIRSEFAPQAKVYWRPRRSLGAFFMMIARLTAGDVKAGILRPGLGTMWARYAAMLVLLWAFGWAGALIYLGYLITKSQIFNLPSRGARLWAIPLQAACDLAVLAGSLLGLASRIIPRENRADAS
jgi:glycosyltransferase involved in cell wall biosynthesis